MVGEAPQNPAELRRIEEWEALYTAEQKQTRKNTKFTRIVDRLEGLSVKSLQEVKQNRNSSEQIQDDGHAPLRGGREACWLNAAIEQEKYCSTSLKGYIQCNHHKKKNRS